jgi:hypothetical protein
MKIRTGFISNSSNSSFIINKKYLTKEQIDKIINHMNYSNTMNLDVGCCNENDAWIIHDNEEEINGYTSMDNFDMHVFLDAIDVPSNKIEWNE